MIVFFAELILFIWMVSIFAFKIEQSRDAVLLDEIDFTKIWFENNYSYVDRETRIDWDTNHAYKHYVYTFDSGSLNADYCLKMWCQKIIWLPWTPAEIKKLWFWEAPMKTPTSPNTIWNWNSYTSNITTKTNWLWVNSGIDISLWLPVPEQINHIWETMILKFDQIIVNDYITKKTRFWVKNLFYNESSSLWYHNEKWKYTTYFSWNIVASAEFEATKTVANWALDIDILKWNYDEIRFNWLPYAWVNPNSTADGWDYFLNYFEIESMANNNTPDIYTNCDNKSKLCKYIKRFDLINNEIEIEYTNSYNITR